MSEQPTRSVFAATAAVVATAALLAIALLAVGMWIGCASREARDIAPFTSPPAKTFAAASSFDVRFAWDPPCGDDIVKTVELEAGALLLEISVPGAKPRTVKLTIRAGGYETLSIPARFDR